MRKMSLLELLFALLLVCLLAVMGGVAFLVWNLVRRAEGQAHDVAELKVRLEAGGQAQGSQAAELRERLSQTQSVVEGLRSALSARQPVEEEARASLRRLESVIAGSSTRGAAGENILEEALRHLPPEMLQRNVWVGGKVVELALRLPGGKLLPMDSKWVSSGALEQLADPALDAARRAQLTGQVDRRHRIAKMKAHRPDAKETSARGREHMLARVLLHVIEAAWPVDDAVNDLTHFQGGSFRTCLG